MSMPAEQEVMEMQGHPTCGPGQRFLVEVPDSFAVARWSRNADVATIARCILGTLKYEPHTADITALRRALESVVAAAHAQSRQEPTMAHATNSPTTVPHVMVHATTGERTVIQLTPKAGWTAAEAQTFLAERKKKAERIDPEACEIGRWFVEAVDLYGIFDVPDEWSCVGNERFVRNVPDGDWVWVGHLPKEKAKALGERIERQRPQ